MKNGALFCLASVLAMVSMSALAFDITSVNYRVSGDKNSGSGNSSSASYKVSQLAIGTVSNVSQSGSYKIILGISMPEINDTFSPACVTNSTACASQQYNFSGYVFSGGGLAGGGTVSITVKGTGDRYASTFGGGYFSISPTFCLVPGRVYSFVLHAESAGKEADMYFRKTANTPSQNITCSITSAACSFKNYAVSGWAMDSQTGGLINNGTVKVSVVETGDTYSTTFSNGYFSANPQLCLVPGRSYTFVLSVSGGGKTGYVSYRRTGV